MSLSDPSISAGASASSSASSSSNRATEISEVLRQEILLSQYRPGERLPSERDLAERFATSRGAIREAVKKLEQLGIVDVRPGGARVVPVSESSLEVIGYLLDLESPPDPEIAQQVMEVGGALISATARLAVEQASDEHLQRILSLVGELETLANAETEGDERGRQIVLELGSLLTEGTGNMVLGLIHKGMRTHFVGRLEALGVHPRPDRLKMRRFARELYRALESREAARASDAMYELFAVIREAVLEALREARAETGPPFDRPTSESTS
jgi:DNA-binding FadR family transcriptional regulator